jgi:heat shock transcription factor
MKQDTPAFLKKLLAMLDQENNCIVWTNEGTSFKIIDREQFTMQTLPQFFKHNNLASFIRQLNMYGFHKVQHIVGEEWEFTHEYFKRDQQDLMSLITRNQTKSSTSSQIGTIQYHQTSMQQQIQAINTQQQELYNMVYNTQQSLQNHQQLVQKILGFLYRVFGNNPKIEGQKMLTYDKGFQLFAQQINSNNNMGDLQDAMDQSKDIQQEINQMAKQMNMTQPNSAFMQSLTPYQLELLQQQMPANGFQQGAQGQQQAQVQELPKQTMEPVVQQPGTPPNNPLPAFNDDLKDPSLALNDDFEFDFEDLDI